VCVRGAIGTVLPGETKIDHPAGPVRFERLDVEAEPDRVFGWIGSRDLPVTVRPGNNPRVLSVVVHGRAGEIVLEIRHRHGPR